MRFLLTISFCLFAYCLFAQRGKLTVHGKVKNELRIVKETTIEVYQDNALILVTENQRNGGFKLDLDLGSVYSVTFKKEGFVDKSIAVIAKSDSTIIGRYFFQLDIELFRVDQNEFDESVLPPAAKLYIKSEDDGFKYDKKYVRWIANQFEEIEE